FDRNAPDFLQRGRIPDTNLRRAVTHVNLFTIVGQAPSFTGIVEASQHAQAGFVVNESGLGLPGQFEDLIIQYSDALSEERLRDIEALKDTAAGEVDFADSRVADDAGSLIEKPVVIFEALGKGCAVMRVALDDSVGVLRRGNQPQKGTKGT